MPLKQVRRYDYWRRINALRKPQYAISDRLCLPVLFPAVNGMNTVASLRNYIRKYKVNSILASAIMVPVISLIRHRKWRYWKSCRQSFMQWITLLHYGPQHSCWSATRWCRPVMLREHCSFRRKYLPNRRSWCIVYWNTCPLNFRSNSATGIIAL
ncbi:hypothetical protein D9M68_758830 [compost metagenome]